jgi:hypothetical protein
VVLEAAVVAVWEEETLVPVWVVAVELACVVAEVPAELAAVVALEALASVELSLDELAATELAAVVVVVVVVVVVWLVVVLLAAELDELLGAPPTHSPPMQVAGEQQSADVTQA